MATTPKKRVVKDLKKKSIPISRTFSSSLKKVCRACTEGELLEK